MSHSALIKFAPVLTAERWSNPRWTRPDRTFYWNGALKLIPGQKTPVVIDHDMERTVGVVHELFTMEWTDGPWICARATLDDPPGWLKTYETKASFARWDVHSTTHDDGWDRVTRAFVKEVSLLSPAVEPAEPLACVTLFTPIEERAARIARAGFRRHCHPRQRSARPSTEHRPGARRPMSRPPCRQPAGPS